jgi:hypothetical protein
MTAPHPATAAVRERSRTTWHRALVADLRVGEADWRRDDRDLQVALAPYHHATGLLGMPTALSFRFAAWRGPSSVQPAVIAFGRRRDVRLEAFGWEVRDTPDGPAYASTRREIDVERLRRWAGG